MKLIATAKLRRYDGRLLNAGDEFEAKDRVGRFLISTGRATAVVVAPEKRQTYSYPTYRKD